MGLVEGLAKVNTASQPEAVAGFNGAWFDRQRHILPGLLTTLWAARDVAKAKRDEAVSRAIKIIMNSFYGVLGSPLCRFFDHRLSGSITLRGHQILTESAAFIEEKGYQVIYGDTDSLFIWLNRECDDGGADAIGNDLARQLNSWWTNRLQQEFGLQSFLEIEYETHYRRFLMPTIRGSERGSKKRYCGLVDDSDGQPKLVFKGLETVRSDWTPLARQFQQELYRRVFLGQPYKDYVQRVVEQLRAGQLDAQLYYRKRLRRALADYQKNIPPQVQAARFAESQGQHFRRGDAVRYLMTLAGPQPEGFISSPVDYDHYLARQLEPVADGLLPFVGEGFKRLTEKQIDLF